MQKKGLKNKDKNMWKGAPLPSLITKFKHVYSTVLEPTAYLHTYNPSKPTRFQTVGTCDYLE